jgi:hypothetical protein
LAVVTKDGAKDAYAWRHEVGVGLSGAQMLIVGSIAESSGSSQIEGAHAFDGKGSRRKSAEIERP